MNYTEQHNEIHRTTPWTTQNNTMKYTEKHNELHITTQLLVITQNNTINYTKQHNEIHRTTQWKTEQNNEHRTTQWSTEQHSETQNNTMILWFIIPFNNLFLTCTPVLSKNTINIVHIHGSQIHLLFNLSYMFRTQTLNSSLVSRLV
jgi:hypothetical protein